MKKEILLMDELGRGFARAIRVGETIHVSGVTGRLDLKTWKEIPEAKGDIRFQASQAFEWLKLVLNKCGSSLDSVYKVNVYLVDFDRLEDVLLVFRKFFPRDPPALNAIGISRLVGIAGLEIEAEALG
jgi:2-iminobutanoate/2-iminopropanoate deaminase